MPPEKSRPTQLSWFERPPTIDGRLDDEAWIKATVFKDFYQIYPGDNLPASKPTVVRAGFDAKYLYFAFEADDDPTKVQANMARRDAIFEDDHVGVLLDTFNDRRRAYELFFNPLGVQADGILTEGAGEDFSIDLVMQSAGSLTKTGYVVEVAIPFKSLRYEIGKDKLWGIHLFRWIKRFNNEQDSWMPFSRDKTGSMNQAGYITGIEGISKGRTLEIIPSLSISESGRRVRLTPAEVATRSQMLIGDRFANRPIHFDPGLTAKLALTPTVTLDFALNPDFAQVETDETVVTANQRFPIFFEEKRPFFLEGIDVFQTQLSVVHMRAIVDPDVAAKLSGKYGRTTFGLLVADDRAPGNFSEDEREDPDVLPEIERFLDKKAHVGILRLKRDVGMESNLGIVATSYNFIEKHNQLLGVDGRLVIDPQTVFEFMAVGTNSRQLFLDAASGEEKYRTGNGFAYNWVYDVTKRKYGYFVGGFGRTKDYRADLGFTQRTGTNRASLGLRYSTEPKPNSSFVSLRGTNFTHINFDWRRRMQLWKSESQMTFNFGRQTYVGAGYERGYERLFEEEFGPIRNHAQAGAFFGDDPERSLNKNQYALFGGTVPSKKVSANFRLVHADRSFDFDFGAGPKYPRVSPPAIISSSAPLDPGPGTLWDFAAEVALQPTNALNLSAHFTKNRLKRHDTNRVAFDANVFSFRGVYQFSRFTFARARIDYDTLDARLKLQLLGAWTPNPGTSFYVGYNEDLNYDGFDPSTGQLEPGLRRNGRTFFVKMSYLFRRTL